MSEGIAPFVFFGARWFRDVCTAALCVACIVAGVAVPRDVSVVTSGALTGVADNTVHEGRRNVQRRRAV